MLPGENASPMHPHCRCSTSAFEDRKAFDEWVGAKADGSFSGSLSEWRETHLTDDEERAIKRYISSDSYKINESLRGGEKLTLDDQLLVRVLDSALKKIPNYSGTVYRSMSSRFMNLYEIFSARHQAGRWVSYPAYTSSGTTIYDEDMDIQLIIKSKRGKDLRAYNNDEKEILFERDSEFVVVRREGKKICLEEK